MPIAIFQCVNEKFGKILLLQITVIRIIKSVTLSDFIFNFSVKEGFCINL